MHPMKSSLTQNICKHYDQNYKTATWCFLSIYRQACTQTPRRVLLKKPAKFRSKQQTCRISQNPQVHYHHHNSTSLVITCPKWMQYIPLYSPSVKIHFITTRNTTRQCTSFLSSYRSDLLLQEKIQAFSDVTLLLGDILKDRDVFRTLGTDHLTSC